MHEEASNGLHAQNFRLDGTEWHFKYHLNHRKTAFIPSFRWWIQIYLVLIPTAVIQNENLHWVATLCLHSTHSVGLQKDAKQHGVVDFHQKSDYKFEKIMT
jgi:hypothetical protein